MESFVTIWGDLRGRLTALRPVCDQRGRVRENLVQQNIQSMLDETLGPRRAVARVSLRDEAPNGNGNVTQTNVVVLVNASPQPLTPANVQLIRNAVIAAADLNPSQGDDVSVEVVPNAALAPASQAAVSLFGTSGAALALLGGIAALGILGLLLTQRSSIGRTTRIPDSQPPAVKKLPPPVPVRSGEALTREHIIDYVSTVARENPESIAKLVKLWLSE